MSNQKIIFAHNIEYLKTLPDNSVDSIVTDAPYGLGKEPVAAEVLKDWLEKGYHKIKSKSGGFMGKSWDAFVPQPLFWKEVFRVLKPGGHVLCSFGTRTYDWGVMAMRFAGFEIRDQVQWIYGTGFPKSMDISKAIDKQSEKTKLFKPFAIHYETQRQLKCLTHNEICENGKFYNNYNHGGASSNWSLGANVATIEQWNILQPLLELSFDFLPLIERVEAEREIIGSKVGIKRYVFSGFQYGENGTDKVELDITIAATDEAKQWQGWGTALKPANEPIVLARKPISEKTVAANILKWGTGAIWIDGCRVGIEELNYNTTSYKESASGEFANQSTKNFITGTKNAVGRFPSNVILDEFAVKMLDEQSRDTGGASRFFYTAKPSNEEKNKFIRDLHEARSKINTHETVKPVSLMRYLVKMITPPVGTCVDPFVGSGTTMIACKLENINGIGIDFIEKNCEIANKRLTAWQPKLYKETSFFDI